ncbi:uncharacterized protein [Elaeis guineensis]|uniref:Uncharacterized protein LOC105035763 isoform X1 n=1 Tax=Elaeis guineensis var. tenera TaxID=51953 RepID=A0A6I9QKB7_ELAGV|nr:uncharacterized protein LOC105035763 isoform X1 [Elaeis guineensis]
MFSPEVVVKNRWLGFLIWQSIASTALYLSTSLLLLRRPSPLAILSFLAFHLSLLLLSLSLFLLSSPHPDPSASLPELAAFLLRVSLRSLVGGFSHSSSSPDAHRRARRALASALFLVICAVSGFLSVAAACGESELLYGSRLVGLGLRGSVFGLVYGLHYVFRKRWILQFPIIQRPLFYSFKMGISSSLKRALKVSTQAFFCSSLLMLFLPDQFKYKSTIGKYIIQQIKFYIGAFTISFCWEISHHLLQVVHTRRCIFAPAQGSAAAETNPSDTLLETLEQSSPRSLLQYLAYLDLCMVAESNVEPWRRAAVFEETGETYRRVVNMCLKPLEQLTSRIAEGLETFPVDKSDFLSQQLNSPTTIQGDSRLNEAFDDSQLCTWCARTLAALTARSHWEDRYGVAQLTGCNSAVVSTLLSCLLAVEACLGKKTNPQPVHLMGPASIRWATVNTGRKDGVTAMTSKKRGAGLHAKAYTMADVLRTSVYQIISAFQADMQANAKASVLEKNWIGEGKPLYGTREILLQKLGLFLDFRAV